MGRGKGTVERVGITSSIPVEVLYAAGVQAVDLNNVFITGARAARIVEDAEATGFPRNVCAWIKGIHQTALRDRSMKRIVAVTQGDCANVRSLVDLWRHQGKEVIPFSYPYDRDREMLSMSVRKLMRRFGVGLRRVERMKERLDRIRRKLGALDRLTWKDGKVTGAENHEWIISGSDFRGDPDVFETDLDEFLACAKKRSGADGGLRIGVIGIPPIWSDFFDYIASRGARVVYNELARQFALLGPTKDLLDQYLAYTYPYDARGRLRDIRAQVRRRRLDGVIHNVQTFCHHQIEDSILREDLGVPTLMIEGDRPGAVDARTRTRIDSFVLILRNIVKKGK